MHTITTGKDINDFRVIGINYKKTDASVRGLFAINNDQYAHLLSVAPKYGLHDLFILSTCNRTEIYAFADSSYNLITFLCEECAGDSATFSEMAYKKNGIEAIEHLYQVGAGLDSQILGDYEILGQIKNAVKFAKERNFIGSFMERLVNSVIQASKAIKTNTALSGGTVSVSFAAIQYIKEHVKDIAGKKILLLGTGKIGRVTCKNLVDYLGTTNITLINRTEEKAANLAQELKLTSAPISDMQAELCTADIILVSTNAAEPMILKHHLQDCGNKLIIDLSVPCNVAVDAQQLPTVTFIDVDHLSKIKDETLQNRKAEVPKAMSIIDEHVAEFKKWCEMRRYVPMLQEVKDKLHTEHMLKHTGMPIAEHEEKVQKVISTLATKMRRNNTAGCHYIEAINDFITK